MIRYLGISFINKTWAFNSQILQTRQEALLFDKYRGACFGVHHCLLYSHALNLILAWVHDIVNNVWNVEHKATISMYKVSV